MVNELIYGLAMLVFAVSILVLGMGVVRPSMFKFLGAKIARWQIVLYSISLLFLSTSVAGMFEPMTHRQARIERETQTESAEQHDPNELQKQEMLSEPQIDQKTPEAKQGPEVPSARAQNPALGSEMLVTGNDGIIKKTWHKICLKPGSRLYQRTTSYTGYKTMNECKKSGGRSHQD